MLRVQRAPLRLRHERVPSAGSHLLEHAAQLAIELDRSLQIAHLNAEVLNGFRLNSRGRNLSPGVGCRTGAYDSDKLPSGKPVHKQRFEIWISARLEAGAEAPFTAS